MAICVNPIALLAGTAGIPIVVNTIGRAVITPATVTTQAQANADLRRMIRNFAIFNFLVAGGLGYAAARVPMGDAAHGAALGGAVGTGILATMLAAALIVGPAPEQPPPPIAAQLPMGVVPPRAAAPWVSNLVGYPR